MRAIFGAMGHLEVVVKLVAAPKDIMSKNDLVIHPCILDPCPLSYLIFKVNRV